ncbi:MAG: hypothetical protein KME17_17960 [Cyanosarcina radialis HA8281-LM2]|jgi:hypothetical protein|nr:hypothetical protein [Cyanosarcina radialis HA8281-LM2]
MDLFSRELPKADPDKIQQLKTWAYQLLEIDSEIPVSISQLRCHEPGCPPIETVIAVMTNPLQQYKIHKSVAEIEMTDIAQIARSR